ncbi:deoxyhypusine synthase family protein [Lentisphaera marina]|uniref:deoxyhypusine synthase family protein n=1 Tax=Lentisphaera marina TaxID=1111041 RepID=UPI0023672173|nr:deoxyhypusine synthase family protein [Lentisphaera marina]MDD7986451.1 deoxyhypusine synthase family protein [Lentisphaera marina]
MKYPELKREQLHILPLSERTNKVKIAESYVPTDAQASNLGEHGSKVINNLLRRVKEAKKNDKPVMLAFGAHSIKNGMGPVLIDLMERGYLDHLATNGAGVIHDWEFAFQGQSSEDVKEYVDKGQFGIWQETGYYINLAINVGAYEGKGYGESVGAMIENEGLTIPTIDELKSRILVLSEQNTEAVAAAADLLTIIQKFELEAGFLSIPHPYKKYSAQAAAYRLGVPFTSHPMIGHDIIYNHPMNHGASIGRTAQTDFLRYAHNVSLLDGGVYMSIGSAVMSPMVFEKSLSMSQNLHIQNGEHMDDHYMVVVDLAESQWDWANDGEPPMDNPAYYLRYCKSFSRMGGTMEYVCADNRDFLLHLSQGLL